MGWGNFFGDLDSRGGATLSFRTGLESIELGRVSEHWGKILCMGKQGWYCYESFRICGFLDFRFCSISVLATVMPTV